MCQWPQMFFVSFFGQGFLQHSKRKSAETFRGHKTGKNAVAKTLYRSKCCQHKNCQRGNFVLLHQDNPLL